MNDEKTEMTTEEAEQDFKDRVEEIFAEKIPGVYRDKDGFIVVPMRRKREKTET